MILSDTQLVLLKIVDLETFCDLDTELDFGRDEIFARIEQLRIKRTDEDAENHRLSEFDDLCALLWHLSPDISLVMAHMIVGIYRVQGKIGKLPHYLKFGDKFNPAVNAGYDHLKYVKYANILSTRYFPKE